MPKVSVLMPVYNTKASYLKTAIKSILNQTFTDFELIILNDGSDNPNVEKNILSFSDSRIKYYKNTTNLGISQSRNKLIDLAAGEYLALFDSDDISTSTRLEKQVIFLDNHPNIGVLGSYYRFYHSPKICKNPISDIEIKQNLLIKSSICNSSVMLRHNILNNIRYNPQYTVAEDYDLWCQLLNKTQFATLPEVLLIYRYHSNNISHSQHSAMLSITDNIRQKARNNNPQLWTNTKDSVFRVKYIKLFNLVPILTCKSNLVTTTIKLFGFIPLLKIIKHKHTSVYYIFQTIPTLWLRRKEQINNKNTQNFE